MNPVRAVHSPLFVLVDPVETTRELLRVILTDEFAGYVTQLTDTGLLLTTLHEARADLVIIEFDTRRPSDLDVVRRLKADPELTDIPILGLIAWAQQPVTCDVLLAAGCSACCAKPFEVDQLISQIRELLPSRS